MKKIIALVGTICAAVMANASVMYWQVSEGEVKETYSEVGSWDLAKLYVKVGTYKDYADFTSSDLVGNIGYVASGTYTDLNPALNAVAGSSGIGWVANLDGLTGTTYSYYVELSTSGGSKVALSAISQGASSDNYIYASTADVSAALSAGGMASLNAGHATSYGPGPEPTSAILMLFGAAMLGLKRKNRSLA